MVRVPLTLTRSTPTFVGGSRDVCACPGLPKDGPSRPRSDAPKQTRALLFSACLLEDVPFSLGSPDDGQKEQAADDDDGDLEGQAERRSIEQAAEDRPANHRHPVAVSKIA